MTENIFGSPSSLTQPSAKFVVSHLRDIMREQGDEETMRAWHDMLSGLLAFGLSYRGAADMHRALIQALEAIDVTLELERSTKED